VSLYNEHELRVILQKMISIAKRAGKIVLEYYFKGNITFAFKEDGSCVSIADITADQYIREQLVNILAGIHIITEESFNAKSSQENTYKDFWLVDPIDGTDGFVSKNDDFVINIALIEDFKPVLGVVHAPVSKKMYFGGSRIGSKASNNDGSYTTLGVNAPPDGGLRLLLYHALPENEERDNFLKHFNVVDTKRNSNMLRFCRIAEGEVDLHICFEETKEWDIAAGHAILNGVGGRISDTNFKEMTYGKKDFKNPGFVAHGNINLSKFILDL
jgi:3'(2'), 5'-bisphosphate nucleotidase